MRFAKPLKTTSTKPSTQSCDDVYAARLVGISEKRWKKLLAPVNPYRLHLKHLVRGRVLEIGCGFGRCLEYLGNSKNFGVEPNETLLTMARTRGHEVCSPQLVSQVLRDQLFDTILFSHVIEHIYKDDATAMIQRYLGFLKSSGFVVVIVPQKAGYRSDSDHKHFWTLGEVKTTLESLGLLITESGSFPLIEQVGSIFKYNEWFVVATNGSRTERR